MAKPLLEEPAPEEPAPEEPAPEEPAPEEPAPEEPAPGEPGEPSGEPAPPRTAKWGGIAIPLLNYNSTDGLSLGLGGEPSTSPTSPTR
ncbi:MAG: hypothetical protein JRI25_06695 [Deltaproteobacteria bacterium]|nr:hypothetical protein [Deltaproteobacteria bacterium]